MFLFLCISITIKQKSKKMINKITDIIILVALVVASVAFGVGI